MNKLTKAALYAAGATLVSQGAHAQFANGDLILGFTAASAANEYVLDLGNYQTSVGVGGSTVFDLSGQFSSGTFNGAFTTGLNGVDMGVVGGSGAFSSSFIYATALRSGLGTPGVAGSSAPGSMLHSDGSGGLQQVVAMVNSLGLSAGNSTTVPRAGDANGYSWFNSISSPTSLQGSFFQSTGYDPDSTATGNVIYEDLYGTPATSAGGDYNFNYVGYFTLDMSGSNPSLTFTPSAVPEPGTMSLFVGAGLVALWFRQRISRKST